MPPRALDRLLARFPLHRAGERPHQRVVEHPGEHAGERVRLRREPGVTGAGRQRLRIGIAEVIPRVAETRGIVQGARTVVVVDGAAQGLGQA